MRITAILAVLLVAAPLCASSAQVTSRDSAIAAFSRDLAKLQRTVDSLNGVRFGASRNWERTGAMMTIAPREWDGLFAEMVKTAKSVADAWKANPYVSIDGFQASVGWPTSITVRFSFKETAEKPAAR